ncbi:MAG: hypothetical protein JO301_11295, partial [Chitinophagaceae bacterium]|nr:hypothetical protein [Chitinophagaceae bacterium]
MQSIRYSLCCVLSCLLQCVLCYSQQQPAAGQPSLPPPVLVEKEQLYAGNPFANYLALKKLEAQYLNAPIREVYLQQVKNFEEFLGFPLAGKEAMQLKTLRSSYGDRKEQLPEGYSPSPVLNVIEEEAGRHNIIIWGEEHHLPQTRSLYPDMIRLLWQKGFRYLAAESFSDAADSSLTYPAYNLGFYTRDPIYADAVRLALQLGYTLVSYDNSERTGRDKKEAETLQQKIFAQNPAAKVLILAGRGHIS